MQKNAKKFRKNFEKNVNLFILYNQHPDNIN
jgi:hypothetical protein